MTNVTMIGDARSVTTVIPVRRDTPWWELALDGTLPGHLMQQYHVRLLSPADVLDRLRLLGYGYMVAIGDAVVVGMGCQGGEWSASAHIAEELGGTVRFGA